MRQKIPSIAVAALVSVLFAGCAKPRVVTLDEYNRISTGMPYTEVVQSVGNNGVESGSASAGAGTANQPGYTSKIYRWHNHDGSYMTCIFGNDKVLGKAQEGLDK